MQARGSDQLLPASHYEAYHDTPWSGQQQSYVGIDLIYDNHRLRLDWKQAEGAEPWHMMLLAKLPTHVAGWSQYLILTVVTRVEFCTPPIARIARSQPVLSQQRT